MLRTAGSVSTIAIAIVTAWTMSATPAFAQRKIINGLIGAGVAGAIISGAAKAMNQDKPRSGNRSGGSESEGSDRSSKNEKRDTEAEARMAKQFLAQWAELNEVRRAMEMERGRNVEIAIQSFLDKLARNHERLQTGGRSVRATKGEINQVTHGQIKIAIEAAYERANLQEFEKFTGEVWTRDRLLVRILTCAGKQLNPYFLGVGAKGPSMDDLKELFQKVGREVFTTALETSEVIGVSKSFDRFIRTIYENSDNTSDVLWTTGADSKYERVTSGVIESVWQRDFIEKGPGAIVADTQALDRQFLYRFRARRALYECLAMTYPELARGGSPTITTNITTTTMVTQRAGIRAPATMPASQQEALWERVRIHIGKTCQGTMPTILASAKSGTIGPVSSRESGLSAQSFIGSVPVGERRQ
jgi:hypothetical protein